MANQRCGWLACAGVLMLLSGCVERRFVIESTPPGAKVYVNNKPVGSTPCDMPFLYYGTYLIQLELDGHQTLIQNEKIRPPWYAYPPIDFVAENIYPFQASDVQRLHYDLSPLPRPNLDELRAQAEELRVRGKELPEPATPPEPANRRGPVPPGQPRSNVAPVAPQPPLPEPTP